MVILIHKVIIIHILLMHNCPFYDNRQILSFFPDDHQLVANFDCLLFGADAVHLAYITFIKTIVILLKPAACWKQGQ